MNIGKSGIKPLTAGLLLAAVLLLLGFAATAAGCSSSHGAVTTSSLPVTTTLSSPATSEGGTTTTTPQILSEYDKEIAKTATAQHQLELYLSDHQVPESDPRMGVIYGLRARTLALSCRKALDAGDLSLADTAMKNVYSMLNLATNVATGATAQTLADARAVVATLGAPSDKPDQAASLLDQFTARLAPLLDQAKAIESATGPT